MNILAATVLGIVEGITEFLPISSTGHLILTAHLLKLQQTEFLKSFEIAIQLGAILSVMVLYGRRFLTDLKVFRRVAVAFMPTAVIGLVLYKIIKRIFFGSNAIVLWSLLLGGVLLIIFELFYREKKDAVGDMASISYTQALIIGLFQSIAIIPGVSRAAATIIGGLVLGLKRKTIVEFSFLLAVPTMGAAVALDLLKSAPAFTGNDLLFLGIGFLVSFTIALLSIKLLLEFIKNNNFIPFGVYRIILALSFFLAGAL